MKLRTSLILSLVPLTAAVAAWLYFVATRQHPHGETREWHATIADLTVCGSRNHMRAARYDHFARVAAEEQRPDAAALFRALALSERLAESNCATAIRRLGGSFSPPSKVVVLRGTTAQNITRSIDEGSRTAGEDRSAGIDRAIDAGNRYAARILVWAAASTRHHLTMLRGAGFAEGACGYAVCPVCGNIYLAAECDPVCPHCLTPEREFIMVGNGTSHNF